MVEITGRDRIVAAMKRNYADRIPVGLILGAFRARILGCPLKDYWTDGKKLAEGTLAAYERFGHDAVEVSWDIMMEAEAAGAELEFRDDSIPQIKRHVLAEKKNLGKLAVPDPGEGGSIPPLPGGLPERLAGAQGAQSRRDRDRTLDHGNRPPGNAGADFRHHRRPGFRG